MKLSDLQAHLRMHREIIFLTLLTSFLAVAVPLPNATSLSSIANQTFDYIIVGCGPAGLTVATRLSENADHTVLCLEAGALDNYEPLIQYPFYIGLQPPLFYDWGLATTPQTQLDGQVRQIPMGKGVGGGSLINGMIWNRGNQDDFNIWSDLGNPGWSWSDLLPYFKKAETFTPKTYAAQNYGSDAFNPAFHGSDGPIQVSYPEYLWPQSSAWFDALEALGIPRSVDPNDGSNAGGYFLPLSIHPTNQTRSDARRAYYDPFQQRPNYNVLPNIQATRILFESSIHDPVGETNRGNLSTEFTSKLNRFVRQQPGLLRATGVEVAAGPMAPRYSVLARREVILAAGAVHTPQLLELSGIGSADVLQSLSIPVLQDLPGVGNNLQDHAMVHMNYSYQNHTLMNVDSFLTNTTFNSESEQQYLTSKTGPWTAKPSTAVGFPSIGQLITSPATFPISLQNSTTYLPDSYDNNTALQTGYIIQLIHILNNLTSPNIPCHEILNSNAGSLDIALMHPLSRGSVHISSANPFDNPEVNPNWLAHPFDFDLMVHATQFNQLLLNTNALAQFQPSYYSPDHPTSPPYNASSEQISQLLKNHVGTEFHYSGTAAMLPREWGGVVDPNLVVYGTRNLRVVDSSIFPTIPGAHLQSIVYAVAEKAADLIKAAAANPVRKG